MLPAHSRRKRFIFNANFTCGSLPFCTQYIHRVDYVTNASILADDPYCSKPRIITSITIDIILSICITLGNFLILFAFVNSKKMRRNPQSIIKTSMAVFDLLVGAVVLPASTGNKLTIFFKPTPPGMNYVKMLRNIEGNASSSVLGALFCSCIAGSLFTLLLLTIDRLMAVRYPFKYLEKKLMTRTKAIILVVIIWIFSFFVALLPIADQLGSRTAPPRFRYYLDYMTLTYILETLPNYLAKPVATIKHGFFFLVIVFIVPYFFVVIVTLVTWMTYAFNCGALRTGGSSQGSTPEETVSETSSVNQQSSRELPEVVNMECNHGQCSKNSENQDGQRKSKKEKKSKSLAKGMKRSRTPEQIKDIETMTRRILFMVISFSISVVPFIILQTENLSPWRGELEHYQAMGTRGGHECYPAAELTFLYLLFFNSLANPIVYSYKNQQFRKQLALGTKRLRQKFKSTTSN